MPKLSDTQIIDNIDTILKEVKEGFSQKITMDSNIKDFELDSLDFINFLFGLEEKYGIALDMETVEKENLYVLENLLKFIKNYNK